METHTGIGTLSKIYRAVRLSLNGEEQDYTVGSIPKAVFLLAIPMILELSLESVFAVVDMFFVSKLGENAIATVGLTESVITIIYSMAMGLSIAATGDCSAENWREKPGIGSACRRTGINHRPAHNGGAEYSRRCLCG